MFKAKTVFILGAGASWHYGYPTGEELVRRIIQKASIAREHFQRFITGPSAAPLTQMPAFVARYSPHTHPTGMQDLIAHWARAATECQDLIERLKTTDPLVIDYFIGHNRDLEDIIRLCIAWVILEREFIHLTYRGNENKGNIHFKKAVVTC